MGWGDEIMAAGEAQRVHDADPQKRKVAICDRNGVVRTNPIWEGNPIIATPADVAAGVHVQRIKNAASARPYLKSLSSAHGAVFTDWKASEHVGRIYLTKEERQAGELLRAMIGPYVVVEPSAKPLGCVNKQWGRERYQAVVTACPDVVWLQMIYDGLPALQGARSVDTKTFRQACGILASARAYLGPEGGLHHAAAVLRIPAVVIFGGYISPKTTGYPWQVNIADDGPGSPCGTWRQCAHCRQVMDRIRPDYVTALLRDVLEAQREGVA